MLRQPFKLYGEHGEPALRPPLRTCAGQGHVTISIGDSLHIWRIEWGARWMCFQVLEDIPSAEKSCLVIGGAGKVFKAVALEAPHLKELSRVQLGEGLALLLREHRVKGLSVNQNPREFVAEHAQQADMHVPTAYNWLGCDTHLGNHPEPTSS